VKNLWPRLVPGPGHRISVAPHVGEVRVTVGDRTIAKSARALELHEGKLPLVIYLPLDDVDRGVLRDSDQHSYCPFKGEASYFDIEVADQHLPGAVWYYPEPYDAVAPIAGHVAFYADKVTISG
jgi:uncharacterized protein (DUF427 family)